MRQALHRLEIATNGQDLVDVTAPIAHWATGQSIATGLLFEHRSSPHRRELVLHLIGE